MPGEGRTFLGRIGQSPRRGWLAGYAGATLGFVYSHAIGTSQRYRTTEEGSSVVYFFFFSCPLLPVLSGLFSFVFFFVALLLFPRRTFDSLTPTSSTFSDIAHQYPRPDIFCRISHLLYIFIFHLDEHFSLLNINSFAMLPDQL